MKKTIFTAAVFSAFLIASGAYAQSSDLGTPNTLHGSGDMMQDGPHAAANPNADAEIGMREPDKQAAHLKMCQNKWTAAKENGTAEGQSHRQFIDECLSSM